jgi:YD repeat-containing protein
VDSACDTLAALIEGRVTDAELAAAVAALQGSIGNLNTTVTFLTASKVGVVNGQPGPAVTLKPSHLGLGPANGPSLQTITRDGLGRIATLSTTVGGQVALQTLTYDAEGRLATVVTVYDGRTRTETLNYTGGALSGLTAVEEITP